ncbi:MAG: twin-arginine translocase TatA/TatE family subunit [Acidobacteriota bacterium]
MPNSGVIESAFALIIPNLGLPEMLVLFVIVLLLFGARRLPELASGLGQGIRTFKKALNEDPDKEKEVQRIEEASKTKS